MSDNVEIVYHACEWDKNYLSDTRVDELIDFLQEANDSQFCFMGEMI
jgi:hypothetical protein